MNNKSACNRCSKIKKIYGNGLCGTCLKSGHEWVCQKCGVMPTENFYKKTQCKKCTLEKIKKGGPIGRPFKLSPEQAELAANMYSNGLSGGKIAEKLNASRSAVLRMFNKMGIKRRPDGITSISNPNVFTEIDTPEKAYWLGFMATDGNVYGTRIQINLARRDEAHLEKFKEFVGGSTLIKHRARKGIGKRNTPYQLSTYSFRCKKLAEDLKNVGILPRKSMTILPWIGPEYLMSHYWRGCIDGDGWITKSGTIGLCGNHMMVNSFSQWTKNFINTEANLYRKRNIYGYSLGGKKAILLIKKLYQEDSISLTRKKSIAIYVLDKAAEDPS